MKKCMIISFLSVSTSLCAPDMKQLAGMTPYALFGLIERAKIAAFSTESFIKSGADPVTVTAWNDLVYSCNQLVLQLIGKSEILMFSRYLFELDTVRQYIQETIDALHAKQKPRTSAQAQKYLLNMYAIEDECFAAIRSNSKPGKDWIAKIPKDPTLSAKHQHIFEDYMYLAQQAEASGHQVAERELLGLLKLHNATGKQAVKLLIDNLEQYCYKKEKFYAYATDLMTDLKALFPDILSSYELSLLANTKDKPNLVIFAQSSAYENILHQIIRELK